MLSVVLITRNQRWNVDRLVSSALRAAARVPGSDVVLVDSASDDGTPEAAACYPIRVYRLCPDQPLTAAAGRYLGQSQTTGELILFLDGDMELRRGWLDQALAIMAARPEVAVVSGQVLDLPKGTPAAGGSDGDDEAGSGEAPVMDCPHGGGAAMYRRAVLERVGPFNPFLYSDEEPELCLRIRSAGYRVVRIERPMVYHYTDPSGSIATLAGRRRRNLYLGPGQAVRRNLRSSLLVPYLRERGYGAVPVLGLLAGAVSLVATIITARPAWFGLWLGALVALTGADALRKGSLYRAGFSLVQRIFFAEGLVRGFLRPVADPGAYPLKFDVIPCRVAERRGEGANR